ncbi:hypothetical protein F8M41_026466 [Gigaspora margarita]|uniref:Uncharacterized protein n=1 Tax=Gigaspora margarita TaxID=4874 RepID=A0A8H3XJU5_GIGMA|nr:hypothetical protein F8M41_026466 [Gigaspora margarita]
MDQENSFTLRYESEDTSDNILEHNSASIVPYEFSSSPCSFEYFTSSNLEYSTSPSYISDSISTIPLESSSCNLEYVASSPNFEYVDLSPNLEYIDSFPNLEYSTSSIYTSNSEEINLSLNDSNNFTAINDTFDYPDDYPDSSNIPTLQNSKKHKSVFVTLSNKKPKPGKSWVWCHMKKDKYVKKETKYKVPVKRDEKIVDCGETFALLRGLPEIM